MKVLQVDKSEVKSWRFFIKASFVGNSEIYALSNVNEVQIEPNLEEVEEVEEVAEVEEVEEFEEDIKNIPP